MHSKTTYITTGLLLCLSSISIANAFTTSTKPSFALPPSLTSHQTQNAATTITTSTTSLNLFGKMFEEDGPLGKGITVGKIQVSLNANDRSSSSIFGLLEDHARNTGDSSPELAEMANEVCLSLMRKSDDWTGACSSSCWFGGDDAGKAESLFNEWANTEAAKFEKEYLPSSKSEEISGGPTQIVVSVILELQGDVTKFDGAGFSIAKTNEVLSSIAADVLVDEGYCVNAVEVFWTPSDRKEVMSKLDVNLDFPEIIDM